MLPTGKLLLLTSATAIVTGSVKPYSFQAPHHKHALLVGINLYSRDPAKVSPNAWRAQIPNLEGSENDVDEMATALGQYGWSSNDTDIVELKGPQATRAAILAAMDKLASEASSQDKVFFFYSGHGSTVKNSKTTKLMLPSSDGKPAMGLSNTIVPSDSLDGAADITDKELADKFNKILDHKAILTAIFDSCFSGEIARGTEDFIRTKAAPPAVLDLHGKDIDVAEPDPTQLPYQRGALILSAARYYEPAAEYPRPFQPGEPRGVFAFALTETIKETLGGVSVGQLFAEARAKVKAMNYPQEPVYECTPDRLSEGLFGDPVTTGTGLQLPVTFHPPDKSGSAILQGGLDHNVHPGATLEAQSATGRASAKVVNATINSSTISYVAGDEQTYIKAPWFKIKDWQPDSATYPGLTLCVPRTNASVAALASLETKLGSSLQNRTLVADPEASAPTVNVAYGTSSWNVARPGMQKPTDLGTSLDASKLSTATNSNDRVFVSLPLAAGLADDLKFGKTDDDMIRQVDSPTDSPDYVLTGAILDGKLKYAWIAPGAGKEDPKLDKSQIPEQRSLADQAGAMPVETEWVDSSDPALTKVLADDAQKLCTLKNWAMLKSVNDGRFPCHLELVDSQTGQPVPQGGAVVGYPNQQARPAQTTDKRYQLKLVLDPGAKVGPGTDTEKRFIYVMDIDRQWNGTLVFPASGSGNTNEWQPVANDPGLNLGNPFRFIEPLGTEHFVLLTSVTPIVSAADLFNFGGFAVRGTPTTKDTDPLARLIRQASSGKRDIETPPVADTWSIQRLNVLSVPPPPAGGSK